MLLVGVEGQGSLVWAVYIPVRGIYCWMFFPEILQFTSYICSACVAMWPHSHSLLIGCYDSSRWAAVESIHELAIQCNPHVICIWKRLEGLLLISIENSQFGRWLNGWGLLSRGKLSKFDWEDVQFWTCQIGIRCQFCIRTPVIFSNSCCFPTSFCESFLPDLNFRGTTEQFMFNDHWPSLYWWLVTGHGCCRIHPFYQPVHD